MKYETIYLILVGVLVIGLTITFAINLYEGNKTKQAIANERIARVKFMSTFPVEKYGYEEGAIPEFFVNPSGEFIYLNDGTSQNIMYKTDWDGNEIDRWDVETTYSYNIKFDDDGMGLITFDSETGEEIYYRMTKAWDVSTAIKQEDKTA